MTTSSWYDVVPVRRHGFELWAVTLDGRPLTLLWSQEAARQYVARRVRAASEVLNGLR